MAEGETGHEWMGAREVCKFFGGATKPIDISTLYRGIKNGVYPKPVKFSARMNRWRRSECDAALREILANHAAGKPILSITGKFAT